jgi:hypothetical protein
MFSWDSYGSMCLSLVMQSVSKRACNGVPNASVANVTKTFTLKGAQTIHHSTKKHLLNDEYFVLL